MTTSSAARMMAGICLSVRLSVCLSVSEIDMGWIHAWLCWVGLLLLLFIYYLLRLIIIYWHQEMHIKSTHTSISSADNKG